MRLSDQEILAMRVWSGSGPSTHLDRIAFGRAIELERALSTLREPAR